MEEHGIHQLQEDRLQKHQNNIQNERSEWIVVTRHLRQNRLSNESRAASRSLSRNEFVVPSICSLLESPTAFSLFIRTSYLACIRCSMVVHISVKPEETNGKQLDQSLHYDQFSLDTDNYIDLPKVFGYYSDLHYNLTVVQKAGISELGVIVSYFFLVLSRLYHIGNLHVNQDRS